ncbi:MAG: hypothetical protein GC206_05515 [Alphaproteobacteria bacterium]|nr:hypothetical protein [Alphaproteobacteria bacterium]
MTAPLDLRRERISPTVQRLQLNETRGQVLALWRSDAAFCDAFSSVLAASGQAFFWETPSLTHAALGDPFECALIAAPSLARPADPSQFAAQIARAEGPCARFANLGGDAELVVPRPIVQTTDYAHLAAFLRTGSPAQSRALWARVAETAADWLARGERIWLSTAGLGVPWLHVRFDRRPKYYAHAPYRAQ